MSKSINRHLAALFATMLIAAPALAETTASDRAQMVVAVMLGGDGARPGAAETPAVPRVELLLHQAERKHRACAADIQNLMRQAYDLVFPAAEIPLGGDETIFTVDRRRAAPAVGPGRDEVVYIGRRTSA